MPRNRYCITIVLAAFLLSMAACDSAPETTDEAPPADPPEIEEEELEQDDPPSEEEDVSEQDDDPLAAPDDVSGVPDGAETTDSGLAYRVLEEGDGETNPSATDVVSVHYTGWTTDGEMFDSSVQRGEPTSFPLNQVIAGWTEGVQLMVEGQKNRFWIPADQAYGEDPAGGRPGGMLVFDIELIEIQ